VRREQELRERLGPDRVRDALRNGRVWAFGLVNFVLLAAGFGLTFFVPDLVQDRTGYTDFEVGVLAAIPFGFATVAMIVASRRAGGIAPLMVTGAAGTLITAYADSALLLTVGITLAAVGLLTALPRFWIGPTALLSGSAAAAGIALVAVLGNLGGFVGPAFTEIAKDSSGGYELPLTVLAAILVACAIVTGPASARRRAARAQPAPR
jgi:nitrate/nitrite transporter NarK